MFFYGTTTIHNSNPQHNFTMSIIINNNASILDKEQHLNIYDRERRISVVEQMENIEGIGESLSKVISYEADESENDEESNYTTFVPIVSTDNYDSVCVHGHNQI